VSAALRLATALSLMAALAACDAEEVETFVDVLTGDVQPPTAGDDVEPVEAKPAFIAAVPEPVLNEHQQWQSDPAYVCEPVFRVKSCTDWGEPVWLDANMGWLPFGEVR